MDKIIRVTGKGESLAKPDTIIIELNVSKTDLNYSNAMQMVDAAVITLKNCLTKVGLNLKTL